MVGEGDPLGPPMSPQATGLPQHLADPGQGLDEHRMAGYTSHYQQRYGVTFMLISKRKDVQICNIDVTKLSAEKLQLCTLKKWGW